MARILYFMSLGMSPEPHLYSLEREVKRRLEEGDEVELVFLYGKPFESQTRAGKSPLDALEKVRGKAGELGLAYHVYQVDDPNSMDSAYRAARRALEERIREFRPDKVVVNFTGGTKPIVGGVIIATLDAAFEKELEYVYVAGRRGAAPEEMRVERISSPLIDFLLERAYGLAERHAYSQARAVLGTVEAESGRAWFLKRALEALYLWDEFRYGEAAPILEELKAAARGVEYYRELADTVERLAGVARLLGEFVEDFRRLKSEEFTRKYYGRIAGRISKAFLLPLDTLENASRRIVEERYSDAVLRSYRAVEQAAQLAVLSKGVNPWATSNSYSGADPRLLAKARGHDNLDLFRIVGLLGEVYGLCLPEKELRSLAQMRNHSVLEHGYQSPGRENAEKAVGYAWNLVAELASCYVGLERGKLEEMKAELRHSL